MGTWKEYKAGKALRLVDTAYWQTDIPTILYKDIEGNERNTIYALTSGHWSFYYGGDPGRSDYVNHIGRYSFLSPMGSEEDISEFDETIYNDTNILPTQFNRFVTVGANSKRVIVYSINVSNPNDESVTLRCFKFTKPVMTGCISYATCLVYAYYLSDPITIAAKESIGLSLSFNVDC